MRQQKKQTTNDALVQLKHHAIFLSLIVPLCLATLLVTSLFGVLENGRIAQALAEYTIYLYSLF